jgi:hypothetical protein
MVLSEGANLTPLNGQGEGVRRRQIAARHSIAAAIAALLSAAAVQPVCAGDDPPAQLERSGTVTHAPIKEASALVASRRQAGVLWTLCDSRNLAQLYAIDRSGRLLGEFDVEGGVNLDWESLSIDDAGHLYIADVGNNLLVPMRWVYQISEPDLNLQVEGGAGEPAARSGSVRVEKAFAYTFPGDPFDVEGTFVRGDAIYLVSKEPEYGRLWSLPITDSGPVQLTFECDLPEVNRATGADISPDGSELAICTYAELLLYHLSSGDDGRLQIERTAAIPFQAEKVEGCCWSPEGVLLISEDRSIYSVAVPREPGAH